MFRFSIILGLFILLGSGCSRDWTDRTFSGTPVISVEMPDDFSTSIKESEKDFSCVFYSESRGRISFLSSFKSNANFESDLEIIVNDIIQPNAENLGTYKQSHAPYLEWEYVADSDDDLKRATFLYKNGNLWIGVMFDLKDSVDWKRIIDSIELGMLSEDSEAK